MPFAAIECSCYNLLLEIFNKCNYKRLFPIVKYNRNLIIRHVHLQYFFVRSDLISDKHLTSVENLKNVVFWSGAGLRVVNCLG